MESFRKNLRDIIVTIAILCIGFVCGLSIQEVFHTEALIPAVFVLGAFLISVVTDGYFYGIVSALAGVLAVNYAFTFPFFRFNFTIPENLVSAIIMIVVAIITCALTTIYGASSALIDHRVLIHKILLLMY